MITIFSLYILACLREGRPLHPRELWFMARREWERRRNKRPAGPVRPEPPADGE